MATVLYFDDVIIPHKAVFPDQEKHPRVKGYRVLVTFAG